MLIDVEKFNNLEKILEKNGTLEKYGKEHGEIRGRMMITLTDIPEELNIKIVDTRSIYAFECSFDFYDTLIGIALHADTFKVASGLWITPQVDGAEAPSQEWVDFFIKTLVESISEDGTFGIPIYTFLYDVGDFTVIPISS